MSVGEKTAWEQIAESSLQTSEALAKKLKQCKELLEECAEILNLSPQIHDSDIVARIRSVIYE